MSCKQMGVHHASLCDGVPQGGHGDRAVQHGAQADSLFLGSLCTQTWLRPGPGGVVQGAVEEGL